ncbi:hypothetical protein POM88_049418 [Heracleum sosnowskyi]|uniref:Uncharacterized protein n=1 Tax=Heracleum sosnowskyi TaxID=360622 RepID=A0AAD8M1J0_9APIA|nr:hypothetical protein POM88_049418 [Heracleum sosnowskyi]
MLLKYWGDESVQKLAEENTEHRKALVETHTLGRKPVSLVIEKMKKSDPNHANLGEVGRQGKKNVSTSTPVAPTEHLYKTRSGAHLFGSVIDTRVDPTTTRTLENTHHSHAQTNAPPSTTNTTQGDRVTELVCIDEIDITDLLLVRFGIAILPSDIIFNTEENKYLFWKRRNLYRPYLKT